MQRTQHQAGPPSYLYDWEWKVVQIVDKIPEAIAVTHKSSKEQKKEVVLIQAHGWFHISCAEAKQLR